MVSGVWFDTVDNNGNEALDLRGDMVSLGMSFVK